MIYSFASLKALIKIKNINVLCICSRTISKAINLSQNTKSSIALQMQNHLFKKTKIL